MSANDKRYFEEYVRYCDDEHWAIFFKFPCHLENLVRRQQAFKMTQAYRNYDPSLYGYSKEDMCLILKDFIPYTTKEVQNCLFSDEIKDFLLEVRR